MVVKDEKIVETKSRPSAKRRNIKKHFLHLFLLPALVFYVGFQVYPIITAFINSFFSFKGMVRQDFVGFDNFIRLFTEEPYNKMFTTAFWHNLIYFVGTVLTKLILAFLLALLINSRIKGREFFKAVFFMPKLLSVIVVGFLFSLILNPTNGALNTFLKSVGLAEWAHPWLGDPNTALYTIILVNSWYGIGFAILIFLAGLQAIPEEIYEAARIDGATGIKMLFQITIPMAMPSIMIMTILTFIGSFETFELIFAMQGSSGGPYYSTDVLALFFYRLAFGSVDGGEAIGLGSALAVILFLIICSATAISLFFFKRKEIEQ
ncbi:carbohydrate ABC transporter permease [Sporosarcina sp. Te-1]|uniref:carbohydrate ABC transporter permease n=1 Tax=Sporosarcina sp. Te-1 TaxID=2818390 RepID=UPI001A9E3CE4|nr:sugar ABC transporter permease [Sporosarcina sp. Te-1]QTD41044.1 sugar ABC transporter permease [Sporosarcina sp. Te-1]